MSMTINEFRGGEGSAGVEFDAPQLKPPQQCHSA
jgi:hypothetical protein